MKFINRARGNRKSMMLIHTAYATDIPIIVSTNNRRDNLLKLAIDLGCEGIDIYTVEERRRFKMSREDLLVDDSDSIIQEALNEYLNGNVIAASMTIPMVNEK